MHFYFIRLNSLIFVFCFIYLGVFVPLKKFSLTHVCLYGDVTITGEGLQLLTYGRHSWPFPFYRQYHIRALSLCLARLSDPWIFSSQSPTQDSWVINSCRLTRIEEGCASCQNVTGSFWLVLVDSTCFVDRSISRNELTTQ